MSAPARKIEAVPTPADELRKAIAALRAEQEKLAATLTRIERLQSLDKDAIDAQAAVDELAAAQTQAFRDWAVSGGNGDAPRVNERACREAAQRLETAIRQRQASHAARQAAEAEYVEQASVVNAADTAVKAAAANVLGREAIEKYQRYRQRFLELLLLEDELTAAQIRLFGLQLPNATAIAVELGEKFLYDHIPDKEIDEMKQRAPNNESARWQALLRGEV